MTQHTTNYAFPYPELSDEPDGATQMENLAVAIDTQMKSNADDAADAVTRAALLTILLGVAAIHRTQATTNASITLATTAAAMTASSAVVGHSFVAPPSGIVLIEWGASVTSTAASGSTVFIGCEIAQGGTVGSGTVQSGVTDAESTQSDGLSNDAAFKARPVTGLTPGNTYNVYLKWRQTGAATATARTPFVVSVPQLA